MYWMLINIWDSWYYFISTHFWQTSIWKTSDICLISRTWDVSS